jgi:two-component system, cell cycle sensor histidine kinase and response regulator CckA
LPSRTPKRSPRSRPSALPPARSRRHVEAALPSEEQKYRTLFEHSFDAVYFTRNDGAVLDANAAACRLHGMTLAELREAGHGRLVLQDQRLAELVRRRAEAGKARGELTLLRKDGSAVPVEVESVVVDPGRPDWTTFVIARDVSPRVRADAELRRLEAAVEQTPASIVITDAAGVIQYVNPAFERTTGWGRAEAFGARPSVLKSGRHGTAFYQAMWAAISSGQVWKGRIVNRSRDGRLFTEDAVIAPVFGEAGAIRNYVAVKRDITKDLELEEELAQAQRLESIGRLAGGVAHDFNNLLTVILGAAETLRDRLAGGRDAPLEEVEEIGAAGQRAAELTRQLLAFARKQPIAPAPLDLNAAVRGAERLLRRALGEDVELRVHLGPSLWTVCCDRGQLEQVILNLAVNARDAMAGGGALTLETRNLPAGEPSPADAPDGAAGDWVELRVRDTGTGMTPDVRAHLFEPFFTTKAPGKGTGLGLATVYGIVRQGGGHVRVESAPGQGSCFRVLLPRWLGPPPEPSGPDAPPAARGHEVVLVVEDDRAVRETTVRALSGGGYRVLVAGGGPEALALVERAGTPPDLVVTDLVMPGMGGRELASVLRARFPGLRLLFVSGYDRDAVQPSGPPDPGARFLPKPFTPSALLASVRAALDAVEPRVAGPGGSGGSPGGIA